MGMEQLKEGVWIIESNYGAWRFTPTNVRQLCAIDDVLSGDHFVMVLARFRIARQHEVGIWRVLLVVVSPMIGKMRKYTCMIYVYDSYDIVMIGMMVVGYGGVFVVAFVSSGDVHQDVVWESDCEEGGSFRVYEMSMFLAR
ncbi:hypothetical protein Efla_007677 [Eimeria flavescens]